MTLIIILISSLMTGCGNKEKKQPTPECLEDAECSVDEKCKEAYCSADYKCVVEEKENCCGNGKCEEQGRENECTCEEDCGTCEKELNYKNEREKTVTAQYLKMMCIEKKCTSGYDVNEQKSTEFFNEFSEKEFTFNIYAKYQIPFDIEDSTFDVEFSLKDMDNTLVDTPIKINEIRIMDGSTILGRSSGKVLSFSEIGDKGEKSIELYYQPEYPEEEKRFEVSIDYEFIPMDRVKDPETNEYVYVPKDKPERDTHEFRLRDEIFIIDKTLIPSE